VGDLAQCLAFLDMACSIRILLLYMLYPSNLHAFIYLQDFLFMHVYINSDLKLMIWRNVFHFNDLAKCVSHSSIIVYADDTVIFVSDKNISDIQHKLTCDLDNISKWCADNELILNFSEGKTEAIYLELIRIYPCKNRRWIFHV
jgi:hypothetical protein